MLLGVRAARGKTCLYHARGVCRFQHPEDYTIPEQASNKARVRAANGRLNKVNGNRVAKFRRFVHEQVRASCKHCWFLHSEQTPQLLHVLIYECMFYGQGLWSLSKGSTFLGYALMMPGYVREAKVSPAVIQRRIEL